MAMVTEETLWARLLESEERPMDVAAARYVLTLEFPQSDVDRMNALAAKARAGTLTDEEDDELETYIRVGNRLSILKAKARLRLKQSEATDK